MEDVFPVGDAKRQFEKARKFMKTLLKAVIGLSLVGVIIFAIKQFLDSRQEEF